MLTDLLQEHTVLSDKILAMEVPPERDSQILRDYSALTNGVEYFSWKENTPLDRVRAKSRFFSLTKYVFQRPKTHIVSFDKKTGGMKTRTINH
jgi:hypothetical protein